MTILKPSPEYHEVDPAEVAESKGLVLFWAGPTMLQIDLDCRAGIQMFQENLSLLVAEFGCECPWIMTTSAGGNHHVHIKIPVPLDPIQRSEWQEVLGSDPERERLGRKRYYDGTRPEPFALFETPSEARRVKEWLNG